MVTHGSKKVKFYPNQCNLPWNFCLSGKHQIQISFLLLQHRKTYHLRLLLILFNTFDQFFHDNFRAKIYLIFLISTIFEE